MPKKPLALGASAILATKRKPGPGPVPAIQRAHTPRGRLVDLNFKVPAEFRLHFKRLALDADLKNVQLLRRAVKAYEREQERELSR